MGNPAETANNTRRRTTGGFSLLEVVIVSVLIGIILAIAIPTWQSQNRQNQDKGAQMRLDVAYNLGQEAAAFNSAKFPENLASVLDDPQASFTTDASNNMEVVSVARIDERTAVYTAMSRSGRCWVLVDRLGEGPSYGATEETCDAGDIDPAGVSAPNWKSVD